MTGSGAVGTGVHEAANEEAVAKRFPQGGLLSLTGVGAMTAPCEPFATLSRSIVPCCWRGRADDRAHARGSAAMARDEAPGSSPNTAKRRSRSGGDGRRQYDSRHLARWAAARKSRAGPDGKQQLATRLLEQAQPALLPARRMASIRFSRPMGNGLGFSRIAS